MVFYELCPRFGNYMQADISANLDVDEFFLKPERPTRVPTYRIRSGARRPHLLGTGVWSAELVDALLSADITGFDTHPVKVLRGRRELEGFIGVRVFGRGGHMDFERSEVRQVSPGLRYHKHVFMNEGEWDGSDVFLIPELGYCVFVTRRFVGAIKDRSLHRFVLPFSPHRRRDELGEAIPPVDTE